MRLQKCFTVSKQIGLLKSSAKRYLFYFFVLWIFFLHTMSKEAFCLVIFFCWVCEVFFPCLFHSLVGSFGFQFFFCWVRKCFVLFWFFYCSGSESFLIGHSYKLLQVHVPHLLQCFSMWGLKRSQKFMLCALCLQDMLYMKISLIVSHHLHWRASVL